MTQNGENPSSRLRQFGGLPKKVSALVEKESDRGTILILAAYVEELLGLIISESCCSEKLGEGLLQFRSPAGDFSSKILLCEAFGLISEDESSAAHCLRKVRNSAAHFDQRGRGFDVLFDSPQTVQQIAVLFEIMNLKLTSTEPEQIRARFVTATRFLTTRLVLRVAEARRATPPRSHQEAAKVARARLKDTEIGKMIAAAENEARDGNPEQLFELMTAYFEALRAATEGQLMSSEPEHSGGTEPCATPNGGPTAPVANPGSTKGPPSVS